MSRGVLMVVWAGYGLAAAAQVDRPTASPPRFAPFAATRPAPLRGAASRPAWGQPAGSQPAAKPAITVDAADHDFGTLLPASKQDHAFKITNAGAAELSIMNIKPNCGCTVAGDYPKTLAPGASGMFPFTLTASILAGPFSKTISVYTNDPAKPELVLTFKGTIRPQVLVQPLSVYLWRNPPGEPGQVEDLPELSERGQT